MNMDMGGSERLVHNLARNLDRSLFNPSIAWFFGNRILKEFEDLNIPLYHVPKVRRINFSTMLKLGDIIKSKDIDIVNAHHFMSMVYSYMGCKITNHAKLIYTEHSVWEIEHVSWKWRIVGSHLLNQADAAVGVNSSVTKQIKKQFKIVDNKIFSIQNGVDLEAFGNNSNKAYFKNNLGFTNNEKIIGIVANFKKIKNHIFLLKAFNELTIDYKNTRLLLIGQGFKDDADNTELELRKFVNEKKLNDKILFLGYRSDIPALLHIMDIFCLTSFKEGLPISLIEAMAAGIPVVGTDVEGIKDVIIPDKNGYLVNSNDVTGLKNTLLSLINNESLRQKMGREAKSLTKDKYSLDQCVKQYQDLFLSVI